MSTTYESDASTATIAAAWASSPLGDPISGPTELWETQPVDHADTPSEDKPTSLARHAAIVAVLAVGLGVGAGIGLAVLDINDTSHPVVAVPSVTEPAGGGPGAIQAVPPQGGVVASDDVPAPNPVVSAAHSTPGGNPAASPDAGSGPADAGSPAVGAPGGPTVIIDIDIPPLPGPAPEQPPGPEPADPDGPELTLQEKTPGDPVAQEGVAQTVTKLPPKPKLTLATPGAQNAGSAVNQAMVPEKP